MTRFHRIGLLLTAGLVLAGCGGGRDFGESLSALNPFSTPEATLPGARTSLLTGAPVASTGSVSVGPATTVDWSQPAGDTMNNSGNVAAGSGGTRAWSTRAANVGGGGFSLGFGSQTLRVAARPIVVDGRAIVFAPDGSVSAHALSNGGRAWSTTVRPESEDALVSGGGVAGAPGVVFVATGYGEAAALDSATGGISWRVPIAAPARSAPTAAAGKLFIVTKTNSVIALNQADGSAAWTFRGVSSRANLLASASPAVSGNTVVVPTSAGDIVALDAATGTQRWIASIAGGGRTLAVTGIGDASASPVIVGDTVYATGAGGRLVALSLSNGSQIWAAALGSAHTPIVSGDAVFIVDLDNNAVAFDRRTGTVRWSTPLPVIRDGNLRSAFAGPLLANGRLWFVSDDQRVVLVDAATGAIGSESELGVAGVLAPIAAGGQVLVLGGDGTLVAFN
jgi:outer membrane protein assembly factor BamB